jgi:alpha-methylacyl-CoA racemase
MSQPLNGIRILDLTRLLPGAYASQMLADFGADVIKVEEPGVGDYGRFLLSQGKGVGLSFTAINRNKRSITLNLKAEQGRAVFLRLVRDADVVLESFRPGVMERLGLDYEQLKEHNPGIVYCAISGYGQDGSYRLKAGHDLNYAGYAGLIDYNRGTNGVPAMPATQLGDLAGGSFLSVIGILAAIVGRGSTGEGRKIDVSMTEGVMALLPIAAATYLTTGTVPRPNHSALDGGLPCYNIYETKDGKYVTLAALEPKFWHTFCTHVGHLELLPFHIPVGPEEREQAMDIIRAIFKSKTRDEWVAELGEVDACLGPVYSMDEALNDPHAQSRGVSVSSGTGDDEVRTLPSFPRISDMQYEDRYAPPTLGQHTDELLHEAGYIIEEIEQLRTGGVI